MLGSALALRCGLAIAAAAAAALAALLMPYPPDVRVAVLIAGVPLVLGLLNSAFVAVLQADLRAGRIAIADVAGRAAALAAVVVVVGARPRLLRRRGRRGRGRRGDAGADLGAGAAAAPRAARAPTGRRCAGCVVAALPLGAALALNEAYFRADALIISLSRPFEELGLYALAWRVSELTATLPGRLPRVGVPAALGLRRALRRAHADRAAHRRRRDDLRRHGRRGGRRAGRARAGPRARRRRLRGRRDAAADPARRRRDRVRQRALRPRPDRAQPPARGAVAQRARAGAERRRSTSRSCPSYGIEAAAWTALGCELVLLAGSGGWSTATSATCPPSPRSPARCPPRR